MKKTLAIGLILLLVIVSIVYAADRFEADDLLYTGKHKLRAYANSTSTLSGQPPAVIIGTLGTTVATTTQTDINNSSTTLPNTYFDSNERIEIEVEGKITGTNGTKAFALYVLDAGIATTTVLQSNSGDYILKCSLTAISTSTQQAFCNMNVNSVTTTMITGNKLSKNLTNGGTVKIHIKNSSGSDVVTASTTKMSIYR